MKEKKQEAPKAKEVIRKDYLVVVPKNFGRGIVPAGDKVKMHKDAATFYLDKGIIKNVK